MIYRGLVRVWPDNSIREFGESLDGLPDGYITVQVKADGSIPTYIEAAARHRNSTELLKILLCCFTIKDGHLEFAFLDSVPLNEILGDEDENAILEFIKQNQDTPIHVG